MKAIDTHPRVRIYISLRILVDKSNEGFPLNPLVTWANGCVSVGGGLETPMLVWRPTARSAPRGRRAARARGVLVAPLYICTVLFPASIFTFSFLNFMCSNFYLQPFLFLLNFLSRNFVSHLSPIFQSQNLLLGLFWLPNFFLYKNFAPRLFSSKFIDVKIF